MNRSKNLRFQKTERRIQDCALNFLEKNPDSTLTVSAICDELSINRSSFYIHHKNIQSVLDAIQSRFHEEHLAQLRREDVISSPSPLSAALKSFIQFFADHQCFYRYYAKNNENALLIGRNTRECLDALFPAGRSHSDLSDLQISYLGEFIQAGAFAVMKRWFNSSGTDSIDDITDLFVKVVRPLEDRANAGVSP